MYLNFKLMHEKGILMTELVTLIAIGQKEAYILKDIPFDYLEEQDFITYIKGSGTKEERVRLSPNGKALVDALTSRGVSEELLLLATDLTEMYEYYGKETGNLMEVKDRLTWFINTTGFSPKVVKNAVEDYLSNSGDYTLRLDNLLWKPQSTAYSVNFSLSDSRLFEIIRKKFNLPIHFYLKPSTKRKTKDTWLFDIMKLKVPKGMTEECYWTGSYKGDQEAFNRLKGQFFKIE